jgi:isoleucyl-tRNA synthetase
MAEYKDTLHLPETEFSMRAGLAQKEPEFVARWQQDKLYERILKQRQGAPKFVFHDGPPYANGSIHHGTLLNKILKDLVVRDRSMAGFYVDFVPGWDCHGLPIEVQVDKELGAKKASMSRREIRAACRAYAQKFIDLQRDQFRRLGGMARWDDPYLTMSADYEAETLRELARFAANGLLYKGLKPVNWCTIHKTALAEAEVEYEDHTSPSIYVAFEMTKKPAAFADPLDVVIWTTTPWTLPANLAVAVHADFEYVAYPVRNRARLVAKELLPQFLAAISEPAFDASKIMATFKGAELEGLRYKHPLFERESPFCLGTHVTLEAGTGCVHTAPGHGAEDFKVGNQYGLEVLSPVDDAGVYTEKAGRYAGQKISEANATIIADLLACQALLSAPGDTVAHRYAHCWRCHKPIIIRATEQTLQRWQELA